MSLVNQSPSKPSKLKRWRVRYLIKNLLALVAIPILDRSNLMGLLTMHRRVRLRRLKVRNRNKTSRYLKRIRRYKWDKVSRSQSLVRSRLMIPHLRLLLGLKSRRKPRLRLRCTLRILLISSKLLLMPLSSQPPSKPSKLKRWRVRDQMRNFLILVTMPILKTQNLMKAAACHLRISQRRPKLIKLNSKLKPNLNLKKR